MTRISPLGSHKTHSTKPVHTYVTSKPQLSSSPEQKEKALESKDSLTLSPQVQKTNANIHHIIFNEPLESTTASLPPLTQMYTSYELQKDEEHLKTIMEILIKNSETKLAYHPDTIEALPHLFGILSGIERQEIFHRIGKYTKEQLNNKIAERRQISGLQRAEIDLILNDVKDISKFYTILQRKERELQEVLPEKNASLLIANFTKELKALEEKRVLRWKEGVVMSHAFEYDETLEEMLEDKPEQQTMTYKFPHQQKSNEITCLTFNKLAELVLADLLEKLQIGEHVYLGSAYCDAKGNDLYVKLDDNEYIALDLTMGKESYAKKEERTTRFSQNQNYNKDDPNNNFLYFLKYIEDIDVSNIQITKKNAYLDKELWQELIMKVIWLIKRNEYEPGYQINSQELDRIFLELKKNHTTSKTLQSCRSLKDYLEKLITNPDQFAPVVWSPKAA